MKKNTKSIFVLSLVSLLSALYLWTDHDLTGDNNDLYATGAGEDDVDSTLLFRQLEESLSANEVEAIDISQNNSSAIDLEQPITICGRNGDNIIGTPPSSEGDEFILQDIFNAAKTNPEYNPSYSCPPFDSSKPVAIIEDNKLGSKFFRTPFGRTGNQLKEFIHALQYSRDKNMQLGIMEDSWMMNTLTSMFMVTDDDDWISRMEQAFCIKILKSKEGLQQAPVFSGYNVKVSKMLYFYKSPKPQEEVISRYINTIKTLFQHYNTGMGVDQYGKQTRDMCSGVNSLFDKDNAGEGGQRTTIYTAIHLRYLEGEFRHLNHTAIRTGCDPVAAMYMRPEYIKSILQPLDMLKHPIVIMTDGENKRGVDRLRLDPEIGPMIRLVPKDSCWIGGDITLGVVANVFIGNPASTFSGFIARTRAALGYSNSYLYRANDADTGEWKTVCKDDCLFGVKASGYSPPVQCPWCH